MLDLCMCRCVSHFGGEWLSGGGSKKNLESLLRDGKFLGKAKLCSFDWLFCHALFLLVFL